MHRLNISDDIWSDHQQLCWRIYSCGMLLRGQLSHSAAEYKHTRRKHKKNSRNIHQSFPIFTLNDWAGIVAPVQLIRCKCHARILKLWSFMCVAETVHELNRLACTAEGQQLTHCKSFPCKICACELYPFYNNVQALTAVSTCLTGEGKIILNYERDHLW